MTEEVDTTIEPRRKRVRAEIFGKRIKIFFSKIPRRILWNFIYGIEVQVSSTVADRKYNRTIILSGKAILKPPDSLKLGSDLLSSLVIIST